MELIMIVIFSIAYLFIILEHNTSINKAATAIAGGIILWVIMIVNTLEKEVLHGKLLHFVSEISGIVFFLLAAMTIVEIMDSHEAFEVIKSRIRTSSKRVLMVIIAIISFFLSAVLDNLTTAIVMVSLLCKITRDKNDRLIYAGLIIIAANAGGAWSPIGDVTTTMLWIGGKISTTAIITNVFIPSLVSLLVPMAFFTFFLKGKVDQENCIEQSESKTSRFEKNFALFGGLIALISVPVFKTVTHLPPFMGILFALSVFWFAVEIVHKGKPHEEKKGFTVESALQKIDTTTVLFFLGILLAVNALDSAGILKKLSSILNQSIGNDSIIVILIGIISAVIDNVPLVAGAIGMYPAAQYPLDSYFWHFLAYCAGTGGSILIIGSAAGVAVMGILKISFLSYLKKVSLPALAGYLAGAGVYLLLK